MYWICLTREELEMIIHYLEAPRLSDAERLKLIEKLEFFRDHENQKPKGFTIKLDK